MIWEWDEQAGWLAIVSFVTAALKCMARPLIRPPKIKHPRRLPPPRYFLRSLHTSHHQSPNQKLSLPPTEGHINFQLRTINLLFLYPLTIGFASSSPSRQVIARKEKQRKGISVKLCAWFCFIAVITHSTNVQRRKSVSAFKPRITFLKRPTQSLVALHQQMSPKVKLVTRGLPCSQADKQAVELSTLLQGIQALQGKLSRVALTGRHTGALQTLLMRQNGVAKIKIVVKYRRGPCSTMSKVTFPKQQKIQKLLQDFVFAMVL